MASYDSTVETRLAQVQYFVECTVLTRVEREYVKKWFAVVSLFDHHQCKVWYGYPTEVWSTVSFDNYCIIPLSNIKCQVVYTKGLVNFVHCNWPGVSLHCITIALMYNIIFYLVHLICKSYR